MSQTLKKNGYNSETAYFFQRDLELIEDMRRKRIAEGHLKLLPGGKSDQKPNAASKRQTK